MRSQVLYWAAQHITSKYTVRRNVSGDYNLLGNFPAQAWQLAQLSNRL